MPKLSDADGKKPGEELLNASSGNHGKDFDFSIIGIGTSAGGLEALKLFFDHVPSECPHSFVVVQHLSPDYKSLMAELLAKNTSLPIHEAKENMTVRPGNIYLIPARKNMTITESGKLHLVHKPAGNELNLPIDIFFASLAKSLGEHSIGIVLTGTGSDGSRGIRSIKEAGGMVMAQDPDTAKFDGMPVSAISTGMVDYVLPIEQMPEELFNFIDHLSNSDTSLDKRFKIDESAFSQLLFRIRNSIGTDFTYYKRPTLLRRIAHRLTIKKCNTVAEYMDLLDKNPLELETLCREFLIGVTRLFRDKDAWKILEEQIVPAIIEANVPGEPIKVWSLGCSTGEEAYSIAILFYEQVKKLGRPIDVKVFATDIDKTHIEKASRGIYPASITTDISPERLEKYFVPHKNAYRILDEVRHMIIFSQHNALEAPPYIKLDLLICRNLLIYLEQEMQKKLLHTIHYSLKKDAFLVLGPSESLGDLTNVFDTVDRKWRIYSNKKVSRTLNVDALRYPDYNRQSLYKSHAGWMTAKRNNTPNDRFASSLSEILLEQVNAAAIYVDQNFDILHAVGNYRSILEMPERQFSVNLLKMVPQNLATALSASLRKATKSQEQIRYQDARLRKDGKVFFYNLLVKPLDLSSHNGSSYLVLFVEDRIEKNSAPTANTDLEEEHSKYILELEEELKETRDNLHAAIEELENSQEEMQTSNEELLSANEELQSTNEELQSVNEELHTVNTEHQQKIEDLADLNADMENLLRSTDIGTIFLDGDMRIRKFTPAISQHFNLINGDIGRPISHFASHMGNQDIEKDARAVLSKGKSISREIRTDDGQWYLKRILPFITGNHKLNGIVITFVNISEVKDAQAALGESEKRFRNIFESATVSIWEVDFSEVLAAVEELKEQSSGDLRKFLDAHEDIVETCAEKIKTISINESSLKMFGAKNKASLLEARKQVFGPAEMSIIPDILEIIGEGGGYYRSNDFPMKTLDGRTIYVILSIFLPPVSETYDRLVVSLVDVSESRRVQEALRNLNESLEQQIRERTKDLTDSEKRYRMLYELSPDMYMEFAPSDAIIRNCNKTIVDRLGYETKAQLIGTTIFSFFHPSSLPEAQKALQQFAESGRVVNAQLAFLHKDGSNIPVMMNMEAVRNENGNIISGTTTARDISDIKFLEKELEKVNRGLERKVRERTRELMDTNRELENFAFAASHDLQEPLNTIINYAGQLNLKYSDKLDDHGQRFLNYTVSAASRLKALVTALLDYSRVRETDIHFKAVNCQLVVRDVLIGLHERIETTQAIIKTAELPACSGNPIMMQQLFQNLIGNAIKFRKLGVRPQITIKAKSKDEFWEYSVRDNGIGIKKEHQKEIFGIFKRLHTQTEYDGTGLGLALCKKIVELHGGKMRIRSQLGKGSTFFFTLRKAENKTK